MAGKPNLDLFARQKRDGRKIVMLTAYDLVSALSARDGGVDAVLVGDSLGMVVLGHPNTLPVTIDDMLHHCRAVTRSAPGIPIIADMPYGSFHVSERETVRHALRLVKEAGVSAVKIEGGKKRRAVIEALSDAEIPVMGHLGLTPQSIHKLGGYKVQGRDRDDAERLREDAALLQELGCFSIVLECMPATLAARITAELDIPTIGIGAGPDCDGQVLVWHDLLGLFEGVRPKFVKRYAELGREVVAAIREYADEVRDGAFPAPEHTYADKAGKTPTNGGGAKDGKNPSHGYLASMENGDN